MISRPEEEEDKSQMHIGMKMQMQKREKGWRLTEKIVEEHGPHSELYRCVCMIYLVCQLPDLIEEVEVCAYR
jgi:hypothetical protein